MDNKVSSSAKMNPIEKTPITSTICIDKISRTRMIEIDQTPCAKNNNIMAQKCQWDDTKISCAIDIINNVHHVPCTSNNDICASKYDIHDPCASDYDIITLSKNNHQEHGIEPIPISNQQNVTTLNKPIKTDKLLITEASNMEELLDNVLKMEQLLASKSTTDTSQITFTTPGNETLLLVMISSMK